MTDRFEERVALGSGEEIHDRMERLEPCIRRRLRGKMLACQQVYDIEDVISSVHRRLHEAWLRGRVPSTSTIAFDRYVYGIARRVALEAVRREARERRRWHLLIKRMSTPTRSYKTARLSAGELLSNIQESDREMLELWVRGLSHALISLRLGISHEAYRSRWRRCRERIRAIVISP